MKIQHSKWVKYRYIRAYTVMVGCILQYRSSQEVLVVKNPSANAGDVRNLGSILDGEDLLKESMATHSSILAWRIPMDRGTWWAI